MSANHATPASGHLASMPSSVTVEERTCLILGDHDREEVPCRSIPARFIIVMLGFCGFLIVFSSRSSFSVAVVAMVNSTSSPTSQTAWIYNGSATGGPAERIKTKPPGQFQWDDTTQGLILGAFYYGYFWPQVLFGQLAERVGGRVVMGVTFLSSAVLNLFIPLAARAAMWVLVLVRFLQGFVEGGIVPSCHFLLGVWSPAQERSRLVNFTYVGMEIGVVVGMMTSGLLSEYGFAGGWPSIFYVHGTLGCVWVLIWMCLIHDSPDQHPRITAREKAYIAATVVRTQKMRTPWRHILTSPPVWAAITLQFVTGWGYNGMMTMLPTFMTRGLYFDLEQNGFLSSIPFLAQCIVHLAGGIGLDFLHNMQVTRYSRKVVNTVGAVLAAAFFIAAGYIPEGSPVIAITLVTLAASCSALCVCCVRVIHLDFAPRFAGTLYGLSNNIASISGFIAPLTAEVQTVEQWRSFFCITAGLYLVGALVFLVLGTQEVQSWANPPSASTATSTTRPRPHSSGREQGDGSGEDTC